MADESEELAALGCARTPRGARAVRRPRRLGARLVHGLANPASQQHATSQQYAGKCSVSGLHTLGTEYAGNGSEAQLLCRQGPENEGLIWRGL